MPKVAPLSTYIPSPSLPQGTFTNISSVELNAAGQIIAINTSANITVPIQGQVLSIIGDTSTIVVNTSTGYPEVGLRFAGSSTGTVQAINSITIDSYGRVQSISTNTIASGTYSNVSSITVDLLGRISSISTSSTSILFTTTSIIFDSSNVNIGNIYSGTTYLTSIQENIYTNYSTTTNTKSSGQVITTYKINALHGITYIDSPTTDFVFDFTGPSNPVGSMRQSTYYSGTRGSVTYTVIVNNTNGKTYGLPAVGNQAQVGLSGWVLYLISYSAETGFLGGLNNRPQGAAGRIEVYTIFVPNPDHYLALVSMASYG